MEIRTVRRPGDKGTRKLLKQYGDQLVCIRYRYDPARRKRYKTIELIIAEQPWQPHAPHPHSQDRERFPSQRYRSQRLGIRISQFETALRKQILDNGGTWHQKEQLWYLPEEEAVKLELLSRVVKRP